MKIKEINMDDKRDQLLGRLEELESEKESILRGDFNKALYFKILDEEREIKNKLGIEFWD